MQTDAPDPAPLDGETDEGALFGVLYTSTATVPAGCVSSRARPAATAAAARPAASR